MTDDHDHDHGDGADDDHGDGAADDHGDGADDDHGDDAADDHGDGAADDHGDGADDDHGDGAGGDGDRPTPRPAQRDVIDADAYPMRVLAGAGTGKTFTMVEKIERLLEAGTAPDEVLALTFTNKAADSMREKLVATVGSRGYDVEAYTYHAVCNELLSEYAYHADVDPRFDVATEADQLQLVYEVLDELPYRFTNPDVYEGLDYATGAPERLFGFVEAMKRAGITPDELDAYLPTPARLAELETVVETVRDAAEHLRTRTRLTADRLDRFDERFDAFVAVLERERDRLDVAGTETDAAGMEAGVPGVEADAAGVEADAAGVEAGAAGMEADVAAYLDAMVATVDALSAYYHANDDRLDDAAFANAHKLPAHLFDAYSSTPKGIPKLASTLPGTLETFVEECQTISDLVPGYRAYQEGLRAANVLDFNDLVTETVALLADDTVADWLSDQYAYVFCDEYQDTDTLQFELVRRLVTDDRLFVVGDDDQAIYEWRGADADNIGPKLDAAYPSLATHELAENFRSKQPILDLANDAIEHLDGRGSDKRLDATFENADADDGVVHVTAEADLEDEAQQITNAITRFVDGTAPDADRAYDPGEIAVLVRKRRHARPVIEALSRAGIPYELAGDITADSVGVETVLAGLKALADPRDEVSINRLLLLRYRLSTADRRRLNTSDGTLEETLTNVADVADVSDVANSPNGANVANSPNGATPESVESVESVDPTEFDDPGRVERAAVDLTALWEQRDVLSVSRLYSELKSQMKLEWFLSQQERRDLAQLDELIGSFDDGAVEPELSRDFVEFLGRHGTITATSSRGREEQPDAAAAGVRIMTIHKSKGLEFPVVVLPELTADEWQPRDRPYDRIEAALDDGSPPARRDFLASDLREARRLLHVAITRAEEWCVLFGRDGASGAGDVDPETMSAATVDDALGDAVPWSVAGVSFPVWETIQDSLPPSATDGTETLAAPVESGERVAAVDGDDRLDRAAARRRVLDLGRQALAGTLTVDPADRVAVTADAISADTAPALERRHSYTSLDAVGTCARQHYLDYVVRAFDDPVSPPAGRGGTGDGGAAGGVSTRTQGILFHEAAERASDRGGATPAEWKQAAARVARVRGETDALPAVEACIDRFFALPASDWGRLSAERDFRIEFGGEVVVGQVDALCRTPAGDLVVLDYKATDRTRDLDTDLQLPLYVIACRELFDEPVDRAGYAYVGSAGPALETRTFTAAALDDYRRRIADRLAAAASSSYESFEQGEHCRWCPHAGLPCGPTDTSNGGPGDD